MNKEEFMKQVKKEISAIPKYANSPSQVDAIAEQMWQEANAIAEKVVEVEKEMTNLDKDFHKKQKRKRK